MKKIFNTCEAAGESEPASLDRVLIECGVLTDPRQAMIALLCEQHLQRHGGDERQCLAALGVSPAMQDALAHGEEGTVAAWLESLAPPAPEPSSSPAPEAASAVEESTDPPYEPYDPLEVSPPTLPLKSVDASNAKLFPLSSGEEADRRTLTAPTAESVTRFYKIRSHSKGGLGKIWLAEDDQFHRKVALKEIREKYADSPEDRSRFLREAEITGWLEHPGIVPVYAVGQFADGRPFYVMRLIRGASLQTAIDRFHQRRRPEQDTTLPAASPAASPAPDDAKTDVKTDTGDASPEVSPSPAPASPARPAWRWSEERSELRRLLRRFLAVCDAVHYAHSRGVIHRDLKPSNIMLGKYGETFVVDWGLAKTLPYAEFQIEDSSSDQISLPTSGDHSTATLAGRVIGTPGFMAPEQAAGEIERLGPAADIYSLGATLYYLLTGRPPFPTAAVEESITRVRAGDFPRPRQVNSRVSRALEAICVKAMAAAPEDRYESAATLGQDVERWLADEPVGAWREPWLYAAARWTRRNRSGSLAGAAALVLIALMSAAAAVWVGAAHDRESMARRNEAQGRRLAEMQKQQAQRLAASLLVKDVEGKERDRPLGWTWKGLEQLEQAAQMAPEALDAFQVRTLAAACLTSVDARLVGRHANLQTAHCVAFHPQGWQLAIAESKSAWIGRATVTLITLADGQARTLEYARDPLWELSEGRQDGGRGLAFSPDGRWLVVGTRSGWLYRWDLRQPQPKAQGWKPRPDEVEVHEVLFSADGASLYAVSRSARGEGTRTVCSVTRWLTQDWPAEPAAVQSLPGVVHLAWPRKPGLLLAAGNEATWLNARDLTIVRRRRPEDLDVGATFGDVAACRATGFLASQCAQTPYVWDDDARRVFSRFRDPPSETGHAGVIRNLAFHPTGRLLASGANEDGLKLWDLVSTSLAHRIPLPGSVTTSPIFSGDGRYLASPAASGVEVYEVRTGTARETAALQAAKLTSFAWSDDGERLLCAGRHDDASPVVLSAWEADGVQRGAWTLDAGWQASDPLQFAFHPAGQIVCAAAGQPLCWLDPSSDASAPPAPVKQAADAWSAVFSHGGSRLWTVEGEGQIQVWQTPAELPGDMTLLRQYSTHGLNVLVGGERILCLTAAGQRVLAGLDSGLVMVMDGESSAPLQLWRTNANRVTALAANSDGQLAAAGMNTGAVGVFRLADGRRLTQFPACEPYGVASVAMDSRGDLLATASDAGRVDLWRRRGNGYERLLTLHAGDGRKVTLQFHPKRPRLATLVEGEHALRVWRLDVLQRAVEQLGAGW